MFYRALGILWWPSAVCGAFAAVLGWRRGRADLADLAESSFDLYHRDLAAALGSVLCPTGRSLPGQVQREVCGRLVLTGAVGVRSMGH